MRETIAWWVFIAICIAVYPVVYGYLYAKVVKLWFMTDMSWIECRIAVNQWAFVKALGG